MIVTTNLSKKPGISVEASPVNTIDYTTFYNNGDKEIIINISNLILNKGLCRLRLWTWLNNSRPQIILKVFNDDYLHEDFSVSGSFNFTSPSDGCYHAKVTVKQNYWDCSGLSVLQEQLADIKQYHYENLGSLLDRC